MAPLTSDRIQDHQDRSDIKHVSRACLECRSRHLKCDGRGPVCSRCLKFNRDCQYVKSNRGGSRKKGVSTKKQKLQDGSASSSKTTKNKHSDAIDGFILPCVKNEVPDLADRDVCKSQCLERETYNKLPPCLTGVKIPEKKKRGIDFHPTFNASKEKLAIDIVFDPKFLKSDPSEYYISPALVRNLDISSIVNTYYNFFHKIHPFMPHRDNVMIYLDSIPFKYDLLLAMKLIGDGQSSSVYSKDVETVNFLITNILEYTKQVGKDFISLQAVLLVSMVSHISSLHDLSSLLRETLVSLALELGINMIDQDNIPPVFMDVNGYVTETNDKVKTGINLMHTPSEGDSKNILNELTSSRRTANIPKDIMEDMVRRTLWEIYFFDTLSGTASGQTTSALATQKMLCFYPKTIPLTTFDYKSRAESCKLVNDAIKLNVAIQANKEIQTHLVHMSAAIGNWEMRIENPDLFKAPYLVNVNGQVNEGVHQSIMLVNYAKIFTHRPFSYLWRPDISRHPRCSDEEGVTDNCQSLKKQEVDSRKIIETRKTIDSASSVVKSLLDTNSAKVLQRTPFLACALAFSCLVHLSAYSWVESSLQVLDEDSESLNSLKNSISEDELDIYTEYIKLELGGIFQISRHWALSNKLTSHIRDTLIKVSPKLFKRVQLSLPDTQQQQQPHHHQPHQSVQIDSGITLPPTVKQRSPRSAHMSDITKLSASTLAITDSGTNTTDLFTGSDTASSFNDPPTTGFNTPVRSGDFPPIMEQPQIMGNQNTPGLDNSNEMNEIDFNLMFDGDLDALSPSSETGCDWVDKHIFEFDAYNINSTS